MMTYWGARVEVDVWHRIPAPVGLKFQQRAHMFTLSMQTSGVPRSKTRPKGLKSSGNDIEAYDQRNGGMWRS